MIVSLKPLRIGKPKFYYSQAMTNPTRMRKLLKIIHITLSDHLKQIYKLANKCSDVAADLQTHMPSIAPLKDARIVIFFFLREGIQSYMLAETLSKNLLNKKWYKSNGYDKAFTNNILRDNKFMKDRYFHHGVWTKAAFFFNFYSEIEHTLRVIAEAYDNGSCNHDKILTLVNNLIDRLGLNQAYKDLWKVFAYTRNTTHSGGFHKHRSGNQSVTYKGRQFDFVQDQPVNFLSPQNLFFILSEIVEFMHEVAKSPDIMAINEIIHPFSEVDFTS